MPEVSLRHLRDRPGWKDGTFLFPACLMICYQRRHLESTLSQFISFVFNHPAGTFGPFASTVVKKRHPEEEDRKKLQASPSISWKYFSFNDGVLRLFSLASWLNNPTAFQGACCFEITLRDYIPTISVIPITRTLSPLFLR